MRMYSNFLLRIDNEANTESNSLYYKKYGSL